MIHFDFKDRRVVVTGGGKGIGKSVVDLFLKAGASVAILDLEPQIPVIATEYRDRCLYLACDVAVSSQVESAFFAIEKAFGKIDYLVNNAGIQTYGTVETTAEALWDRTMNVNLKGVFLATHFAIPLLKKGAESVVVNVASIQSFVSQNNVCAYTTAKSALLGFTRSVAIDFSPQIRCVAVCPGTVDTPMLRHAIEESPDPSEVLEECIAMHPVKRLAHPDEIANLILYLCSSEASFITGQAIRIDGGLGISLIGSKRAS